MKEELEDYKKKEELAKAKPVFSIKLLGSENADGTAAEWSMNETKLLEYKGDYKDLEVTTMQFHS